MAIRVLRLIEYVFEDERSAEANMTRWKTSLKTPHMTMKSAIIQDLDWTQSEQDPEESTP